MTRDFLWPHLQALPYFRALLRAVEASLVSRVRLAEPVLDLGCGDGHFGSVAFDRPPTVGVDPDPVSLREAGARKVYPLLLAATGERLPFAKGAFASAVSNSVLEHIPPLQPVLNELGRVVRPGGRLVITVPNPGYLEHLALRRGPESIGLARLGRAYAEWFRRVTRTVNLEWEESWSARLGQAGFLVERSVRYFPPAALRVLEWGHYFGLPSLLARKLTGRWILAPWRLSLGLTEVFLRRYYRQPLAGDGTYSLYVARRSE